MGGRTVDLESRYGEIDIPILMKGGWFDAFASGTLRNFIGVRASGGDGARSGTRLQMAPVCHRPWSSRVVTFPNAPEMMFDLDPSLWDEQLKDTATIDSAAPVRLYVMAPPRQGPDNEGFWINSTTYPLSHALSAGPMAMARLIK